jgi:hypothetical protein
VSVLSLRASNAGFVIDSTPDGDSKALRSWPLSGSPPDTLVQFRFLLWVREK